jgi:galactonate dehydratase
MKQTIDKLELFIVPPRWLFLKITASDGTIGWGEPIVEGKAETVKACVEEMSEFLIGKPVGNIEDIFQTLYRGGFYRGGPVLTSSISGIEQALWDIKGKILGVPIYEMLGGPVREKMRVYAWIGGDTPADAAKMAKQRLSEGYTAMKMNVVGQMEWIDNPSHVENAAAQMAAVREAVGNEISIGIDFHGRVHKPMAKAMFRALEPYSPMFYEEPLLSQNNEFLPELARSTTVPIATGERMFTRWDFKQVLTAGGVDILQPDISHTGGIWECRKIAAMAEAYDVAVAPHCPLGPITLAASLQLDFCTPNAFIQEQSLGIHYHNSVEMHDYLVDGSGFIYENGFVLRTDKPGLGIEINEEVVREQAKIGHKWRNPIWRAGDGTIIEW